MRADVLRRVSAIVAHETRLLARAPGPLIGYTVMPLLLMTVLQPTLERLSRVSPLEVSGTAHAAAGMAVMFALSARGTRGIGCARARRASARC
jgi:ABC-2 type transport system permease protein